MPRIERPLKSGTAERLYTQMVATGIRIFRAADMNADCDLLYATINGLDEANIVAASLPGDRITPGTLTSDAIAPDVFQPLMTDNADYDTQAFLPTTSPSERLLAEATWTSRGGRVLVFGMWNGNDSFGTPAADLTVDTRLRLDGTGTGGTEITIARTTVRPLSGMQHAAAAVVLGSPTVTAASHRIALTLDLYGPFTGGALVLAARQLALLEFRV